MFDVLKELGIAFDEDVYFLVERAAEVHQLRGRAARDPISRSSMLYAAATIEPLVLTLLETNGLDVAKFERSLGFKLRPKLAAPPSRQPVGFEVSAEGKMALRGYLSITPKRPLDPLGLAATFLMEPTGPIERHLIEAGLRIDQAAERASLFTKFSLNNGAVDPIAAGYVFSQLADSILRNAREDAHKREIAFEPLTTSQVFIAAATSFDRWESSAPWFLSTFIKERFPEGWQNVVNEWMAWYATTNRQPSRLLWSQPLTAIVERARVLAHDSRRDRIPEISARHVVGALIASRRWAANCGIPELLTKLNVDSNELTEKYFSYLDTTPTPSARDDVGVWRSFLGIRQESFVPRFDAEGFDGADLLNITENVNAFASLLASKKIDPPLSIGLFGDWGSGKSFFMARMREEIAERARRATGQENCVFYKRIVQVDFNAWHYVEANLWASLVEHLFRNLKLTHEKPGEQKVRERREGLLQKLDDFMAERIAAEAAVKKAEIERDRAAETLEARKTAAEARAGAARGLHGQDIWDLIKIDDQTRVDLQKCLEQLGVGGAVRSNEELRRTFDDLRSVSTRTKLQFAWLFRQPRAICFLLLLVLLAPFGAAAILKLLHMFQPQLAEFSATIIRFISYAGVITVWLMNRLGNAKAILDRIDHARNAIDEKIQAAENTRRLKFADADTAHAAAVKNVANAKGELERNEKQVANAKQALLELTNGYRLTRFIDERAGSDDYRKLLGVLATVRNDFSTLSELMYPIDRKSTLSDELHIERIILYIDDLDRCHPDRVVEVLQAVHLLLAFKLFVVVGVDARWVSESLSQKHRALRGKENDRADNTDDAGVAGDAVAPHDYLEKIFQVPFWLDPMQPQTTMNYIGSLLAGDIDSRGVARRSDQPDSAIRTTAEDANGVTQQRRTATVWHTIDDREGAYTDPKQLTIDEKEAEYMSGELIAGLVARSPRTSKRYVNTYRFFRASLSKEMMDAYLADTMPPPYRCALMLLAIVVGVPDVSLEVLAQMRVHPEIATAEFARGLVIGDDHIEQWERVKIALIGFENGTSPLAPILDQLPRVVRYSFRAPHAPATAKKSTQKPERVDRLPIRDGGPAQAQPEV